MNAAFKFYSCTLNYLLTIEKKKGKELTEVRELNMVIQGSYGDKNLVLMQNIVVVLC